MAILIVVVIYIVLISVCFVAPARVGLVLFVINLFIPDPLPFVDEILMLVGVIKSFADENV